MVDEDLFSLAVAQTIDALSFSQTHEVDSDFRAHSRATIESVRSLQREQRNRIESLYGPRAASPNFLGTQLLAEYRGEAMSVQLAKESGDPQLTTAISGMTDNQCKLFKKEMKQRIHEWEGCVRDATGQADVTAEQKAPLRSIYELYKVSKGKVSATEARGMSTRSNTVEQSVSVAPSTTVRNSDASVLSGVNNSATTRLSSSAAGADDTSLTSAKTIANTSTATTANNNGGATAAADANDIGSSIPRVPIGTTPAEQLSDADLNVEKRRLKQVLHRFESEFERVKGERPNRRDRRGFTAEYHRYGELKNEIARREGKPATN